MPRSVPAVKRVVALDEDDPHGTFDPLWYDRSEPDTPPGLILNAAAYVFLWLVAGFMMAARLYWLPDRLWCWVIGYVARRRQTGDKSL